jgi:hypothetical protein
MSAHSPNLAKTKSLLAEMVAETEQLKQAAGGSVTDAVAGWLGQQYLLAARERLTASEGNGRFDVLRLFMQDWATLRRGDHSAARLQLDREELDWLRTNSKLQKDQDFREWIQRPEIRRKFLPENAPGISAETLKKIESELRLL